MFNLPDLTALAADTPASVVCLSSMSHALILAATGIMENRANWKGASYELTTAETDEIDALVALMEMELIMPMCTLGTIAGQDADDVNITGGVIAGVDLSALGIDVIPASSGGAFIRLRAPAGQPAGLFLYRENENRWAIQENTDAESGANAGSNLLFSRYDDNGALIDHVGQINRNTGTWLINQGFRHMGSTLGFYGAANGAKPTISGSRAGNAALASLLTALATMGLITNSTTA